MRGCTAYFVGGPRHGDISRLPEAVSIYNVAVLDDTNAHYVDKHSDITMTAASIGKYERQAPIVLERRRFPIHDSFVYVWQGLR